MAKWKPAGILLLCFLLPSAVLFSAFAAMGMAPFGDKSILIMDMSDQYIEFLNGLKHGDVFFSWSKALGGNYIGVFAYYVSSPFSLLTLLSPNSMMPIAVLFLTVMKIGLAGLSFGFFLRYRFKQTGAAMVLFSMFYALMSYNIGYSMGIMWLDGVLWLPVLMIGAEQILAEKRAYLLTGALFVSFLSTYYISYMTGLFTALYFLYRSLEEKAGWRAFVRGMGRLAGSVALAAMGGAFLLLPALASLYQGKIGSASADYAGLFNFSWRDAALKLLPGSYDSITNGGTPFLYCGAMAMILFGAFFFMKAIPLDSKVRTGCFSLLLLLSFWLAPLDRVWHVFQYPNWFPHRYAFLLSFLVILTAYRAMLALPRPRRPVVWLLAAVCAADMYINAAGILRGLDAEFGYQSYSGYYEHQELLAPLIGKIKEEEAAFYRTGATFERSKNDAAGFGYNGITHYSSAYNRSVNDMLRRLGFAQSYFWSSYYGSTMVTDAVFSVKHILSRDEVPPYYKAVMASGPAVLYENPYAVSTGMAANMAAMSGFRYGSHPFDSQNRLIRGLTGLEEEVWTALPVAAAEGDQSTVYTLQGNGMPVYAYFSNKENRGRLLVNGVFASDLFTSDTDCVQYIGTFAPGEGVEVAVEYPGKIDGIFYYLDMDAFNRAVAVMQAAELKVESYSRGRMTGTIKAREGDALFTTIPYDKGWSVYVDGKKAETEPVLEALLAVPLSGGEHRIEMIYRPAGLRIGIAVSALTGLACVVWLAVSGARRRAGKRAWLGSSSGD